MCYSQSIESLQSFGIPEITRLLRRQRYTLHKVDSLLDRHPGSKVEATWGWFTTSGLYGERRKSGECVFAIRKDSGGLYLEIRYSTQKEVKGETVSTPYRLRYDLVKRESNLKPGTYRYYIKDPYSTLDGEGLCTRLYFIPELEEFVPRSVLDSWGVRYRQQRKGHKDRYFFPGTRTPSTKYRKSHYRGKETPFWRSYRERREEEDYRLLVYYAGTGISRGILPPDLERELLGEYCLHSERKTLPRPFAVYRTRKYTHRRR